MCVVALSCWKNLLLLHDLHHKSLRTSAVLLDVNAAVLLQLMLMIQTNQFAVDAEPMIFLEISPI